MRANLKQFIKHLLIASLVVSGGLSAGRVNAFESSNLQSSNSQFPSSQFPSTQFPSFQFSSNDRARVNDVDQQSRAVITALRWAQREQNNFRSKADVIKEVKSRYQAKVLKVTLNERRATYTVRVLLPNGKIKTLRISALR